MGLQSEKISKLEDFSFEQVSGSTCEMQSVGMAGVGVGAILQPKMGQRSKKNFFENPSESAEGGVIIRHLSSFLGLGKTHPTHPLRLEAFTTT